MANTQFDDFIKRQKSATTEGVDWNSRRVEWLDSLTQLFGEVRRLLKEYIDRGDIEVTTEPIELHEEALGSYQTERLLLQIGPQRVELNPVGAVVIGARGRVDMVGAAGRAKLVLVSEDMTSARLRMGIGKSEQTKVLGSSDWRWKIATPPPTVSFIELTAESLMEAIMEVADG